MKHLCDNNYDPRFLKVEKVDKYWIIKRFDQQLPIIPNFCPFCGEKLDD